jgi:hypothetical protein
MGIEPAMEERFSCPYPFEIMECGRGGWGWELFNYDLRHAFPFISCSGMGGVEGAGYVRLPVVK